MTGDAVLLVTSCVVPSAGLTQLSDPGRRLDETVRALGRWLELQPGRPVVVCDGSGFDLGPAIARLAPDAARTVEVLSFTNDQDAVARHGKGYGEGEIVAHALRHSRLLSRADWFVKCTAKLWAPNLDRFLALAGTEAAFSYRGRWRPDFVDTRLFAARRGFYEERLLHAYRDVRDDQGRFLEYVFRDALAGQPAGRWVAGVPPLIFGVAGSTAEVYRPSAARNTLKGLRNRLFRALG